MPRSSLYGSKRRGGGGGALLPFNINFSTSSIPSSFTGGNYSISSGKAINTPTEGSEGSTNGDFESWASATDANNWTEQIAGTSTVNRESTSVHGGSFAVRYDHDGSDSLGRVFQSSTGISTNSFIILRYWSRGSDTTPKASFTGTAAGLNNNPNRSLTTSYQEFIANGLTSSANPQLFPDTATATNKSVYYDDISFKQITLASAFTTIDFKRADVILKGFVRAITGTFIGVIACLDSTSSPANFVVAWCTDTVARMVKFVAGTPTDVIGVTSITYVAGAALEIRKSGTSFSLYYNGTIVGSPQTVSDSGIISNTRHGLFSLYSGNQFDSFFVQAN